MLRLAEKNPTAKPESEGRTPHTDPGDAVPKPKDQRNFTDPESKIMKTSNKGFDQCGNAQAVANEDQIIVSADVTDQANDSRQVEPMVAQTLENLDTIGVTENIGAFTADAGYFSEDNVTTLEANQRIEAAYIATGRLKHHEQVPDAPKGQQREGLVVLPAEPIADFVIRHAFWLMDTSLFSSETLRPNLGFDCLF